MKIINFDGRIGANGAEIRMTQGGIPYVKFSVANNTFSNGQEKTEWFEVTSYDTHVIENRIKALTKGTYVIVTGQLNTDVRVKDGKVWVNQYVRANSIDIPYFGRKSEDEQNVHEIKENISTQYNHEPLVSTYTKQMPNVQPQPQQQQQSKSQFIPEPEYNNDFNGDELPF
jgi:single-stranded DNA-binding protein